MVAAKVSRHEAATTDASKWQPVEDMMINNDERRRREFIFETARGGGDRRRLLGSVSIHVTGLTYTELGDTTFMTRNVIVATKGPAHYRATSAYMVVLHTEAPVLRLF